jgi:hypothetical protein
MSLADVAKALDAVARDAHETFGSLDARQLNWKPGETRWSVAQCFDHLLTANRLMLERAQDAIVNPTRTLWQRVPFLPSLWGYALICSQAPNMGKFRAPASARPATSEIPGDIVQRFVDQHRDAVEWARSLSERDAAKTIMVSPFVRVVTYSVLDGCRIVAAHDRRHFEQARRVLASPGFPTV